MVSIVFKINIKPLFTPKVAMKWNSHSNFVGIHFVYQRLGSFYGWHIKTGSSRPTDSASWVLKDLLDVRYANKTVKIQIIFYSVALTTNIFGMLPKF